MFPCCQKRIEGNSRMSIRRVVEVSFVFFSLAFIGLTGCSKQPSSEDSAQEGGLPIPAAFEIKEILVNADSVDAQIHAGSTDPVVITIKSHGNSSGVEIHAKLFALANGVLAASHKLNLEKSSADEQTITFKSAKPWEPGRYLVEVTVDGKLAGHRDLDIVENTPSPP